MALIELNVFFVAASFDWESILPVLFFLIYGVVQFFGAKNKKIESEEATSPTRDEAEERARKIREEIRRKIQERTTTVEARREPEFKPVPSKPNPTSTLHFPERQQKGGQSFEAAPSQARDDANKDAEESSYRLIEKQIAEQARILRESQNQRDAALRKAKEISTRSGRGKLNQPTCSDNSQSIAEFVHALKQPGNARKAIIAAEILGKPKGLHPESSELKIGGF